MVHNTSAVGTNVQMRCASERKMMAVFRVTARLCIGFGDC